MLVCTALQPCKMCLGLSEHFLVVGLWVYELKEAGVLRMWKKVWPLPCIFCVCEFLGGRDGENGGDWENAGKSLPSCLGQQNCPKGMHSMYISHLAPLIMVLNTGFTSVPQVLKWSTFLPHHQRRRPPSFHSSRRALISTSTTTFWWMWVEVMRHQPLWWVCPHTLLLYPACAQFNCVDQLFPFICIWHKVDFTIRRTCRLCAVDVLQLLFAHCICLYFAWNDSYQNVLILSIMMLRVFARRMQLLLHLCSLFLICIFIRLLQKQSCASRWAETLISLVMSNQPLSRSMASPSSTQAGISWPAPKRDQEKL